jgi:hypothetical protein
MTSNYEIARQNVAARKSKRQKEQDQRVAKYHEDRRQEASRLLGRQVDHRGSQAFWSGVDAAKQRQAEEAARPKPPEPHAQDGRLTAAGAAAIIAAENSAAAGTDWAAEVVPWENAPLDMQTFSQQSANIWSDE